MPVPEFIYLDNNSTTKIDSRVFEAIIPYYKDAYGNASSSHFFGKTISRDVNRARQKVADLIGATPQELVFTSGATESLNLAIKGYVLNNHERGRHIITFQTEHKAVLDTCKYIESLGFEVSYLPVNKDGLIDLEVLSNIIRTDTILVIAMLVNNEIGTIQPIERIARIAHEAGAILMCDATQALGKIPVDVYEMQIDLMAFSGHKIYAPKGVGGLFIKKGKNKIEPLIHGGGHENGLRSGTLNVPGIIGLGIACEIAKEEMNHNHQSISMLRDYIENELRKLQGVFINGNIASRIYNVSNLCFSGIDADLLMGKMKNIVVSNGSACTSAILSPSHVLKAIGLSDKDAMSSIRFSLGKYNTEEEIKYTVNLVKEQIVELRLNYA